MAKYITTKYGTKINVEGLTPEQVTKVRSVAEDKGAYGAKGTALADTLRKKNTAAAPGTSGTSPAPAAPAAPGAPAGKTLSTDDMLRALHKADPKTLNKRYTDAELKAAYAKLSQPATPTPPTSTPEAPPQPESPLNTPVPVSGESLGVDPKTGQIDPNAAVPTITGASIDDTNKNFQMNNPANQVDASGNSQQIIVDPVTGETTIKQSAGAGLSAANQAFTNAATDFGSNGKSAAQAAADANYNYITKDYQREKDQEFQLVKQDLAGRGIPFDSRPGSAYDNAIKAFDSKWQGKFDQAKSLALTTGNDTLRTQAGVVGTLGQTVAGQSPTFTAFQGGNSTVADQLQALLGTISDADLQKYGIDKDTAVKLKQIKAQASGGGGGGDTGPLIGGNAPGFGV